MIFLPSAHFHQNIIAEQENVSVQLANHGVMKTHLVWIFHLAVSLSQTVVFVFLSKKEHSGVL